MSGTPHSTRREFLQGRAAADALAEAIWPAASETWAEGATALPTPATGGGYLVHLTRRAMACQFEFFLNAGQYPNGTELALSALDLVDQLEDQLTVFRSHSEISRLNRYAAEEAVPVEPRLFALLQTAIAIHAATGGAYDVTSAPLSNVWGFTRRNGAIPATEQLVAALQRVGSEHLLLDPESHSVRFAQEGLEINLGSIGKGFALDRAGELLLAGGVRDFLLHGGHSSVLARGAHGERGAEGGWLVGIRHPLRPDRRLGELCLRDQALATSGSGTQYFIHEGRRYGHILDPRSGWPADGVLTVSVLAPTAAEADALSTAFYVLGPAGAEQYFQKHADVAAVMISPGVRAGGLEIHTWGLEPGQWMLLEDQRA